MRRIKDIVVPASFFGIILGLVGLGNCWRVASRLWALPTWPGESIMLGATLVWALLILLYAAKWLWLPQEGQAEYRHPVLCCFIGLAPVSSALIAVAIRPYAPEAAWLLALASIIGTLAFGVWRTGQLWTGGRDPAATTPVLYLPTTGGSFVCVITLSTFGHQDWAWPFFGMGLLSWLAIESVLWHRLYTAAEMSPPLRPTLGIQLAPPVVGCAAYLAMTGGPPDLFAKALFGYGVLQALILLRLLPWIGKNGFAPGFWGFTFGISAMPLSALRFVERGDDGPIAAAAPWLFGAANLLIGGIALGTLILLARGKLLPPRLMPPS